MSDRSDVLKGHCPCGSGKAFGDCHAPMEDNPEVVHVPFARGPVTRRLDLAAGQNPREGFEGVDIWPGAQHVVDLQCYPWPFEDGSVAELHCSHYIEHIPMGFISGVHDSPNVLPYPIRMEDSTVHYGAHAGKDALLAFFDECYRILADDGTMDLIWPSHRSDRAFMDPTHRRFIPPQFTLYLRADWRRDTKLDHYKVDCDFLAEVNPSIPTEVSLRHEQVQIHQINNFWNTTVDWIAKLKKVTKPK